MLNYQLYKTNILLGGLVCWDIHLNNNLNLMYVSDFHVTPINHNIPYNYMPDEYILNNTHLYNVLNLYKNISGNFYNGYIDSKFTHDYPIITDNKLSIEDIHNNIYEIGCQRTEFGMYGKQFEFLCPLWLEKLNENDNLNFDIEVTNINGSLLSKKTLYFKIIDEEYKFHNKFIEYFNKYLEFNGISKGNDNVIRIDLSNKSSFISGLEITSGNLEVKSNDDLVFNILSRERPLMEVDSMIINSFKLHNMIANQLFNIRFHFNLEDILPIHLIKNVAWGNFKINVHAKIGDEYIECKDMYDNFEFIQRQYCSNKYNKDESFDKIKENVLDYLKDDQCIDLINKNKLYSSIIHWSLSDSNEYIFNVYDGFAGYSKTSTNNVLHKHLYSDTPDIYQLEYSQSLNNCGWCSYIEVLSGNPDLPLEKRINDNNLKKLYISELNDSMDVIYRKLIDEFPQTSIGWMHHIKYEIPEHNILNRNKILLLYYNGNIQDLNLDLKQIEGELYLLIDKKYNDMAIFVSNSWDDLTFAGFKDKIKKSTEDDYLKKLYEYLNCAQNIPIVVFHKTVSISKAPSPSLSTSEIEYYKKDNIKKYIFRYDGKIKPTFLTIELSKTHNKYYYKQVMSKDDLKKDKIYTKYLPLKFPPIYKSIEYFSIMSEILNFDDPLDVYKDNALEYKWYNNSKIMYTPEEISNIEFNLDSGFTTLEFEQKLYDTIKLKYNINNEEIINFIKKNYLYNYLYFIKKEGEKNIFKYDIKLKLK